MVGCSCEYDWLQPLLNATLCEWCERRAKARRKPHTEIQTKIPHTKRTECGCNAMHLSASKMHFEFAAHIHVRNLYVQHTARELLGFFRRRQQLNVKMIEREENERKWTSKSLQLSTCEKWKWMTSTALTCVDNNKQKNVTNNKVILMKRTQDVVNALKLCCDLRLKTKKKPQ